MVSLLFIIIFLIIFFIISIPIFFVEWLIGKVSKRAKAVSSLRIVQAAFKIVLFLSGTRTTIIGKENIPLDEPVLFIGNHRGFFDIVIAYSVMPRVTGFVAKKEMLKVPIIRSWMRNLYCLFLDRDNIKEGMKTILKGIDYIKNEQVSIVIFPEGHRNSEDDVKEFKEGSFKFAQKSGCKIIPMVQNNTDLIFERQMPFIKGTKTILEFGKPIEMDKLDAENRKHIGAYTRKVIQEIYEKNKTL